MEHRLSMRKRVRGAARVDSPATGPLSAVLRDVSLGGLYVECQPFVLPLHRIVQVCFALDSEAEEPAFRADALVVRRDRSGAGLMFVDMPADTAERLRQALYERDLPARSISAAAGAASGAVEGPRAP